MEDAKVKNRVVTVEATIEECEEHTQEESEKMKEAAKDDETKIGTEANGDGDDTGESEKTTSVDNEIVGHYAEWEEDDNSEECEDNVTDKEENVVGENESSEDEVSEDEIEDRDEDELGKEEGIEEEDVEEVECSEPEAMEGECDEENMQEGKEIKTEDGKDAEEHDAAVTNLSLKKIENSKSSQRSRKKKRARKRKKVSLGDKPEPSNKKKGKKRVESMGMIFMCSSKTKDDCYKYGILGLPESKKDVVVKIYSGMRLFLYDVDLKLLYGIYKAAGPGGYNIEPKAFKSQFPSQVRFTVLNNCLPLAEEKFKKVIKDNYFTKTKFDCSLKSEQVKKLCKLFIDSSKGFKHTNSSQGCKGAKLVRKGKASSQRVGSKRRGASREEFPHNERARKRPKKAISQSPPVRHPLPAGPSYASARTSDLNAHRRDPYLEVRSSYNDRRNPISSHRDRYREGRYSPTERRDYYREGQSTYIERRYPYRDELDYIEHTDPYRDGKDSYSMNRGHVYLEPRNSYRDDRDPYLRSRDSFRNWQDPFPDRPDPHRDGPYPKPHSRSYKWDSFTSQGIEICDSYRRDELVDRRVLPLLSLETKRSDDIGNQDSYVAYQGRLSCAEPFYSADYPSRTGLARNYRL